MNHYDCLLETTSDPIIRSLILEVIKDEKTPANLHMNNVFEQFKTKDFNGILDDTYMTLLLLSQPEYWLFYLNDLDFLCYIKSDWEEFKTMIKNFDEKNEGEKKDCEDEEKDEYEELRAKKYKKLKILVKIINKIYPDHFKL